MTKHERQLRAIERVWNKFDKNKSGTLTFHELTSLGMSADDAALFFRAFDRNGSYRIEQAEFVKLVERHFVPVFRVFDPNDDGTILISDLKVRDCLVTRSTTIDDRQRPTTTDHYRRRAAFASSDCA